MITIDRLNFGYSKHKILFKDISLNLKAGHIYGLLGKNGAGKSTLLKNIAGLVYPQSGQLNVLGLDPTKRPPALLSEIFFIPEEFYLPAISIDAYVKTMAPFYKRFDHGYFTSLLEELDIPARQKLINMSYGQKKKLLIAFGLAAQTKLIIMDEPTNGLDIPSKAQFRKIMAAALTDDRCVIISTHQVRDLDNLIDTVIMLDENQVALNATVDEITSKLCFRRVPAITDQVLYAESSISGFNAVMANTDKEDSKLDMELLFNAVVLEKQKITPYFN